MRAEPVSAEVGEWRYVINGTRLSRVIGLEDKIVSWPVARWIAFRARNGQSLPGDTADRLRRIVVAETGLPLFQIHEHGSDEVVVKFSIDRNVPSYRDGDLESLRIRYGDCIVPFTEFTRRLGRVRSAMHDREAILLLRGPGIRQGVRLPDAQVVDVAPTLLRAAGLPVPSGLDGHLLDVFAEAQPTLLAAG